MHALAPALADIDPSRLLAASLRRVGLRQPAQFAFRRVPPLHDITLRLVEFLTDRPTSPFSRRPLLDSCLDAALTAYFQLDASPIENAHRYLKTLIARAADVLGVDATAGEHRWDPCGPESLTEWLVRFPEAIVVPRPIEAPRQMPGTFRVVLANRLLSPSDRDALRITAHEAAIPPE